MPNITEPTTQDFSLGPQPIVSPPNLGIMPPEAHSIAKQELTILKKDGLRHTFPIIAQVV